jgi:RNA polymerase sigma-70 factor (sigma-E family)
MTTMNGLDAEFTEFVASSSSGMRRIAAAYTGDRIAAEDVVQDVLMRMYVAWERIDDPIAYARRALANASADRWRRRNRRPEHLRADLPERAAGDAMAAHDLQDQIVRALSSLPPRQRSVVALRYLDGRPTAEVASVLGCSVGTVKSQTARALERLRRAMPSSPLDAHETDCGAVVPPHDRDPVGPAQTARKLSKAAIGGPTFTRRRNVA